MQKMEIVNWKELIRIAVERGNEYCINLKRLAPLCGVKVKGQVENLIA